MIIGRGKEHNMEKWVTVNGRHVLISDNGEPVREEDKKLLKSTNIKGPTTKDTSKEDRQIERACQNVNPNYTKHKAFTINCQKCVAAFEANMRGDDVEALSWTENMLDKEGRIYDWKKVFGLKSSDGWGYSDRLDRENTIKNIRMDMEDFGVGSRGVIEYSWDKVGAGRFKDSNGKHVINVLQTDSGTKFVDAQSGGILQDKDILKYYKRGSVTLYRVDDRPINKDAASQAYKRR